MAERLTPEERAQRMLNLRGEFLAPGGYNHRCNGVRLLRNWALLCGHRSTVESVDSFVTFIEEDDHAST